MFFAIFVFFAIIDLYRGGKSLADSLFSDFFRRGREWQEQYGLRDTLNAGNWLMPCSIRDHYGSFLLNILPADAKPTNEDARLALEDPEYRRMMSEFDGRLEELTGCLWEAEYKSRVPIRFKGSFGKV